jgi:NAD(P)-dependent dehydrogenase (short-subunit alcohol dehydrogenase family)
LTGFSSPVLSPCFWPEFITVSVPHPPDNSVLITGCSSGIGLCCARTLQKLGYRVFATTRKADDCAQLAAYGLESLQLDLDNSDSIQQAVDEILRRTDGTLYALVNNGAWGQPGAVEDLSRQVLRAQFETNLFGTAELTNRVIPVMRRQGHGRIVQISSVLGLVALKYRGAYVASKFALEGLTDCLRLELADSDIRISLIEPGPIASHFRANAYQKYLENIDSDHSVHRESYRAMEQRLQHQGDAVPFTLPPDAVVKKVVHALESPRPRLRYYVTVPTYLFGWLKRLLGDRLLDRLLTKV